MPTNLIMMSSRCDDLNVDDILKKRMQRFRIERGIFENDPGIKHDNNSHQGELCHTENADAGGVLKLGQDTQNINFRREGVDVFHPLCAGKLFDDALLHKNFCDDKPPTIQNHPLFHVSCTDLHEVIQRGLLKQPMKNKGIFSCLNKYLFFLTSCHGSKLLVNASCDTLLYHLLSTEEGKTPKWMPTKEDIVMVFCNYGASRELLASWDTPLVKQATPHEAPKECLPHNPGLMNIPWVLRVITLLLVRHKSVCYSVEELDSLLCVILTVSLDKYVMTAHAVEINLEFSKCIKSILTAYPSSEWQKCGKVAEFSRALYHKLQHVRINDIYFIIKNYISCPGFGEKLAMTLMYAFVQGMLWSNCAIAYVDNVGVEHIRKIFKVDSLLNMDYYSQYFVLLMVENVITNLIFSMKDSKELKRIRQLLSNLRIKSPHSEDMVDYLLVKELITRAATTWKLSVAEL